MHEQDADHQSDATYASNRSTRRIRPTVSVKLPSVTGKEAWKVWYNRFAEVADRHGWTEKKRLDELLPKLQGAAGEFVFGHLTKQVRSNYQSLIQELKNRYRVVETAKTFGVQFSRRSQKPGESVEEYAADLKRLYDKDKQTRQEDLLRRFLDGLLDKKASFQVEYVKDPEDIDEAVFDVVSFAAAKQHQDSREYELKRPKKATRMVHSYESDSESQKSAKKIKNAQAKRQHSDSDSEDDEMTGDDYKGTVACKHGDRAARIPNKGQPEQKLQAKQNNGNPNKGKASKTEKQGNKDQHQLTDVLEKLTGTIENMSERLSQLEENTVKKAGNGSSVNKSGPQPGKLLKNNSIICYACGVPGHISRECPTRVPRTQARTPFASGHSKWPQLSTVFLI